MVFVVGKLLFAAIFWETKFGNSGVNQVFEQKCPKSKHLLSAKKEQCFALC